MPPTWHSSGIINEALKIIEMKQVSGCDEFDSAGLGNVRSNDDILDLIALATEQ